MYFYLYIPHIWCILHFNSVKKMKKLIDINEEDGTFERLQIKAVKAKKDLKNYIQDVLIEHAKN